MRSHEVMGKTKRQVSSPRVTTMPPSTNSRKAGGTMTRPLSSTLYWYSPNGIVSQAPGEGEACRHALEAWFVWCCTHAGASLGRNAQLYHKPPRFPTTIFDSGPEVVFLPLSRFLAGRLVNFAPPTCTFGRGFRRVR